MGTDSSFLSTPSLSREAPRVRHIAMDTLEVGLVFGLIMAGVWTLQGRINTVVCLAAALLVIALSLVSSFSGRQLGLHRPLSGVAVMLGFGGLFVVMIVFAGTFTRAWGLPHAVPWTRAWQYAVWALVQEFILQSFFFVRLERIFGGRRAVWAAAVLFAIAHIPSPLLTALSFLGALFFCEMFRRYRNIFPLGLVHAALGLTIAASLPDSILHHMRVGIGFLMYHP